MDYFLNKRLDDEIKRHGRENLDYFLENKDEDEQDNFGEVTTDFSDSVEVANMYAYIRGEELMDELASEYKRDRINDRKRSDRNNNKMFDSGNDFKFRK